MEIAPIYTHKIVDLQNDANYVFSIAPQGDGRARYIDVSILNNSEPYPIPSTAYASIDGKNAGNYEIHNQCYIDFTNSIVRIPLHLGILSFAGIGKYLITITDNGGSVISFPFNIVVTEAPYDIVRLEASDSYEALSNLVQIAKDSNKWNVGEEDPISMSDAYGINDYYLCILNGNVYHCELDIYDEKHWILIGNIKEKIYIRYSHNSDGSNMTTNPVITGDNYSIYIGIYTGLENNANNLTNTDYQWFLFRNGITNIEQTTIGGVGSNKRQGITVYYDNGTSSDEFEFFNGESGDSAGFGTPTSSIVESVSYPEVSVSTDPSSPDTAKIFNFDFEVRGAKWFFGTELTSTPGNEQTITSRTSDTNIVGDMYLNSDNGCIYRCNETTDNDSKWICIINLKSSATGFMDIASYAQDAISSGYVGTVNKTVEFADSVRVSGTLLANTGTITLTSNNSMFKENDTKDYLFKFYTSIDGVQPLHVVSKSITDNNMSITLKFVKQSTDMEVIVEVLRR